jgi:hypothetical protein
MTKTTTINGTPVSFYGTNGVMDMEATFPTRAAAQGFADGMAAKGLAPNLLPNRDGTTAVIVTALAAQIEALA